MPQNLFVQFMLGMGMPSHAFRARTLLAIAAFLWAQDLWAVEKLQFNRDIRPILSDTCFRCHGPDDKQRQSQLRLDLRDSALQPAESGERAIVPGNALASQLVRRLRADNPLERMPPPDSGKTLTTDQIEILTAWVQQGAEYQGHWAFQTVERPAVPQVDGNGFQLRNVIDHFVAARLQREGLSLAPEADRAQLLRRVTLDLTGVPPTMGELEAFLQNPDSNAYEQEVDRLLQSPRYGERMAIQWLDLARYADSNGFQIDSSRQMWPWRDWVIRAFNANMLFDQFTIEQLAGDLLPDATPSQRLATGFNRNHRLNGEGGIIAEEWRIETVIDRVETTGLTWLALTLNCCRCHDHKYDPISQREFYQLFAFFNNVEESGTLQGESRNTDPVISVASEQQLQQEQEFSQRISRLEAKLADALTSLPQHLAAWEPGFREQLSKTGTPWKWLDPQSVSATGGAMFMRQADGTLLVSGAHPEHDTYQISAPIAAGRLTAVLLDCLPDLSLPNQSLGRFANGNFVLTRIEAEVTASGLTTPLIAKFNQAEADYSQPGWEIQFTVAGDRAKGWAVDGPTRREPCRAMFLLETPIEVPDHATLTIRLVQETLAQHQIGRFRLAISSLPRDLLALTGTPVPQSLIRILATPTEQRTAEEVEELHQFFRKESDGLIHQTELAIAAERKKLEEFRRSLPNVMVMKEAAQPRETAILIRGQYDRPGEKVLAAVPAAFSPLPADQPANRLALARWLVDRRHPLTARVWVNRVWEKFFGTGIVKTTENFGSQSEWPSHLELLDWLACEFMEPTTANPDPAVGVSAKQPAGWNMKQLQKLIVMSATYRQSSDFAKKATVLEKDPENRLLSRGPRFRLPAELLRDQALAVSGLLDDRIGGPSVRPYMPDGVWDETSVYGDLRNYRHDTNGDLYRRSLYTVWKRTAAPPTMLLFDAPNRETCTVKRSRTNTPLQALSLMNEVTFVESARRLAERMISECNGTKDERLSYGFRLTTSRVPGPNELQILREGLDQDMQRFQQERDAAVRLISVGESKPAATIEPAELAAYTMAANVLLNLDEFVTRE